MKPCQTMNQPSFRPELTNQCSCTAAARRPANREIADQTCCLTTTSLYNGMVGFFRFGLGDNFILDFVGAGFLLNSIDWLPVAS